jgi:hypothetical protein
MSFWSVLKKLPIVNLFVKQEDDWVVVRNRDDKGRYVPDDKTTVKVNEAYVKVKTTPKGKFKDTLPEPGHQNDAVKKPVKKRAPRKPKAEKK